jgi:hypothetical protein
MAPTTKIETAIRCMMRQQSGDLLRLCASYALNSQCEPHHAASTFYKHGQLMSGGHQWLAHRGLDALYFGYILDAVMDEICA